MQVESYLTLQKKKKKVKVCEFKVSHFFDFDFSRCCVLVRFVLPLATAQALGLCRERFDLSEKCTL